MEQLRSKQELKTGWQLKQQDDSKEEWLTVKEIPSQVHVDLLANEKIPDPFLDLNELGVQWIEEKDWIYRTSFEADLTLGIITDLVFHGLDTFASVMLNGVKILESDNMHITHRVNVSRHLQAGKHNVLEILFHSATRRGRELIEQHPEHTFHVRQTEASRVPVRKAQYHWGWDWGPILNTFGPWRPVFLEQYVVRVDDVWAQYQVTSDLKSCSGFLYARTSSGSDTSYHVIMTLSYNGLPVLEKQCGVDQDGLAKAEFELQNPILWYPHGYGAQPRYQLSAQLVRDEIKFDSQIKLIGFRRAELVQEHDKFGKSFYFRVNSIDTFAGGSCWIPADSFSTQISRDRYYDWIKLLVEGNQVLIRVWGGGFYEDDAFLDACDELGVLVWHDFAFACASYPTYPAYLSSVEEEARQNIRRLRTHPSVIAWAGNNEDYQVQERYKLEYRPEDKDPESWLKSSFPARYIYEYLLPKLVKEEDPFNNYHPSSPWGDGKHTTDTTVGDIHQWDIWNGKMLRYQDSDQLSGRFVSEFGMVAYPHLQTIQRAIIDPSQQHPGSKLMDFRNKAFDHERRLLTYVAENFLVASDLPSFAHITQVLQAETMRYAYKNWRRMWGSTGARKCGGALVWQLNDCWPTMSWAVVDYHLVKKPAFYAISRALRPLDIGISRNCPEWTSGHADPTRIDTCVFDVWIASSVQEATVVEVTIRFISIKSGESIREDIVETVAANPNSTTEVIQRYTVPADAVTDIGGKHQDPYVVHGTAKVAGQIVAVDTAWPQPYKYLDFSSRNVKVDVSSAKDTITVTADLPVKGFVFDEKIETKFSDNGFDIMPGEKYTIHYSGKEHALDDLAWRYVGSHLY
ncbi:hypothetical protein S40288_07967 [Stachybotrys chartarum IBT 40288]|nr:hypothetical protein S40288_07967 [Stachybotrys chartarum IBT 40288]